MRCYFALVIDFDIVGFVRQVWSYYNFGLKVAGLGCFAVVDVVVGTLNFGIN